MSARKIATIAALALVAGCGNETHGSGPAGAAGGSARNGGAIGASGGGGGHAAGGSGGATTGTGGARATGGTAGSKASGGAAGVSASGGTPASGGATAGAGGATRATGGASATGGVAGGSAGGSAGSTRPTGGTAGRTAGSGGAVGGAAGTSAAGGNQGGASGPLSTDDPNVVAIVVDSGPKGSTYVNGPFATITLCEPGTSTCQTIDHLLIDTGSTGIRVLESAVKLNLPAATGSSGKNLAECLPFMSGSSWGPVRTADFKIGGETASKMKLQLIGELTYPMDSRCSGTPITDLDTLGSNGILGVGLEAEDCGSSCASQTSNPGLYYECSSNKAGGCTMAAVPTANQIANPIVSFETDNNGSFLQFPTIPAAGAPSVDGFLVFGIGTRANNGLGSAKIFPTNSNGFVTTTYGSTQYNSFIDSGSNGLYFLDATHSKISTCSSGNWTGFYCPQSTTDFSATITNKNGASAQVSFSVANPTKFSSSNYAFSTLGGPMMDEGSTSSLNIGFDWGFPFYFGRTVFTAIQGKSTPGGSGPFFAF